MALAKAGIEKSGFLTNWRDVLVRDFPRNGGTVRRRFRLNRCSFCIVVTSGVRSFKHVGNAVYMVVRPR